MIPRSKSMRGYAVSTASRSPAGISSSPSPRTSASTPPVTSANRPEQVNPQRVGEQERCTVLPQQVGRLAGELAIGDSDPRDDVEHDSTPDKEPFVSVAAPAPDGGVPTALTFL